MIAESVGEKILNELWSIMNNNQITESSSLDYRIKLFSTRGKEPWFILAECIIVGAVIGGLISIFLKPVYEAKALITTNMELHTNGTITEIMLDEQISHIGELVFHPDVVSSLMEIEAAQGNMLTLEDLHKKTDIERQLMNTLIKVKDHDPQVAARIASEWAEILFNRLNEAYTHAVRLSEAKLMYEILSSCINDASTTYQSYCESLTYDQIQSELDHVNSIILEESPKSLGLMLALNVSQYQPAAIPAEPLYYQRGTLILSGGGIGLVVGILINEALYNQKKTHEL